MIGLEEFIIFSLEEKDRLAINSFYLAAQQFDCYDFSKCKLFLT